LVAIFFATLAPTLSWPQFSNDGEDILVQTVLEIRNGGPWWVPTLGGRPRTRKPPIPAWITAASVWPQTIHDLPSTQPAVRDKAYQNLAFEVRLPALIAACLTLLAVGWLANLVGGPSHVLPAMIVCATSILFLKCIRLATTDVYLALCVILANCFLAMALLHHRRWRGYCGAGIAVGFALMCKGPVALAMTAAPAVVFELRARLLQTRKAAPRRASWVLPVATAVILMLVVALPWPMSVFVRDRGNLGVWAKELQGERGASISHDPWYGYIALLPNLLPWVPFCLAGAYLVARKPRHTKPIMFALIFTIIPIIVLSFFHDRKDRYVFPLTAVTSILAAHAIVRLRRDASHPSAASQWLLLAHWIIIGTIAIGLPVAGAWKLVRPEGQPWFSLPLAMFAALFAFTLLIIAIINRQRWSNGFVVVGSALILSTTVLFLHGWSRSVSGLSEMRPVADRIHAMIPNGKVVFFDPPPSHKPVTLDLDIYLDQPVAVITTPPPSAGYERAQAVVLLWRENAPEPSFPGWQKAFDLTSRKHHWYVMTPVLQ
jgi:4-amino-4-deoxy-L-arabinose transferase-like glycosyltransferase